jgi:antitoxin PrlF
MTVTFERQARVTSKGQVTIPQAVRRALGVRDGDTVVFRAQDGVVTIASARKPSLAELLAGFDPERHRHDRHERPWDDALTGRESI